MDACCEVEQGVAFAQVAGLDPADDLSLCADLPAGVLTASPGGGRQLVNCDVTGVYLLVRCHDAPFRLCGVG